MSAKAGTIAMPGSHRPVRSYWLAALVLAAMLASLGVWALVAREEARAPAVKIQPQVTQQGPTDGGVVAPPGFRYGPNGEAYPAPRVGR